MQGWIPSLGSTHQALPVPAISNASVARKVVILPNSLRLESTVLSPDANNQTGYPYEITRVIRNSIFGQVHHAVQLVNHEQIPGAYRRLMPLREVAIKVYDRATLRRLAHTTHENPLTEIAAMQFMQSFGGGHPNVINQVECTMDAENVFSVLEFINGGELFERLEEIQSSNSPTGFDEPTARHYFHQIASGLRYVHSFGIGHRDLSLENILVGLDGQCKIIDFGMCVKLSPELSVASNALPLERTALTGQDYSNFLIPPDGVCGKKNYIAPEIIIGTEPFSPCKVDVWALGVILFVLLVGSPPMDYACDLDLRFRMIASGQLGLLLEAWQVTHLSPLAVDLITAMLSANPRDRPNLDQILDHPWLRINS